MLGFDFWNKIFMNKINFFEKYKQILQGKMLQKYWYKDHQELFNPINLD